MLQSIMKVTTAASDLALLTLAELRDAVGAADKKSDDDLRALGSAVNRRISSICRIRPDGTLAPTLRQEAITETFRLVDRYATGPLTEELYLSRRPIVSVQSVLEDDTALTEGTDFETLDSLGMLRRLFSDLPAIWGFGAVKMVVSYTAGWETVPDDLKWAAKQIARTYWFQNSRDPAIRQITVPGVIERQFWVGSGSSPDIAQNVLDMLSPYVMPAR